MPDDDAPPPAAWRRRAKPLLGTLVEIAVPACDDETLRAWSEPAFDAIARIHSAMSFHEAGSELRALARLRGGQSLQVSADTWQTLQLALEMERDSGGLFNAAVAPLAVKRGWLPAPGDASSGAAHSALAAIELLAGNVVQLRMPVWLDLGGIAKGQAVDVAVQALQTAGATAGLVNAGGDLRAFGEGAHEISVRDPRAPHRRLPVAQFSDGAFATSGAYFHDDDRLAIHVIGPPHTEPRWASVSVAAPRCAVADALTKVLALAGTDAAPLLRRHGAQGLLVDVHGMILHV